MDTNELFKAAVPLFAGMHGGARVDAVKVLTDWLGTAGQKIVQGMPIGSMQNLADNAGNVRFGPGLLGNEDVIKRFPILKIVEKQLMEMGSLKGDGVFRVDEFLSEFRRITQQGADLYYGVATNTLKKAVPAVGKKAAKEAITYKTGTTGADLISIPSNLMRAVMSDMWLNSRPGHWIRNAASASTQLLAKGLYTWRSIEDIANNYARRLGIPGDEALNLMPTLRTVDALGGVPSIAENTENFTRKFWPNNNPYAGLMEWGAQRWGGTQQLLKNIPVAEQSLYLVGLDRGMERAFRQYWSMAISQQIAPLFDIIQHRLNFRWRQRLLRTGDDQRDGCSGDVRFLGQIQQPGLNPDLFQLPAKAAQIVIGDAVRLALAMTGQEPYHPFPAATQPLQGLGHGLLAQSLHFLAAPAIVDVQLPVQSQPQFAHPIRQQIGIDEHQG